MDLYLLFQDFNRFLGIHDYQSKMYSPKLIMHVYACRRRSIEGGYFILLVRLKDLDSDVVRVDV